MKLEQVKKQIDEYFENCGKDLEQILIERGFDIKPLDMGLTKDLDNMNKIIEDNQKDLFTKLMIPKHKFGIEGHDAYAMAGYRENIENDKK